MMRRLIACSLAALLAFLPLESFAVLKGVAAAPGLQQASNVAITGGSITGVIGATNVLAATGVSIGIAPTGTMGNNGAVTLGTALDRTYAEGLWLFYPAGAVAAGIPAAASFLWTVMSSATAGTVFNSTYATGVPAVGVTTAFVTTGPGAFTGSTAEVFVIIPVAAGAQGAMGSLDAEMSWRNNNSAGTKTGRVRWSGVGGTALVTNAASTIQQTLVRVVIVNMTTTAQTWWVGLMTVGSTVLNTNGNVAVDTTAATSVVFSMQLNTATDWQLIQWSRVRLDRSA